MRNENKIKTTKVMKRNIKIQIATSGEIICKQVEGEIMLVEIMEVDIWHLLEQIKIEEMAENYPYLCELLEYLK